MTNLIDELVGMTYDLARRENLTLDEAAAIVRRELERVISALPAPAEDGGSNQRGTERSEPSSSSPPPYSPPSGQRDSR